MCLQEVGDDPDARVAVVKGAGRAFCAGDDMSGGPREPVPPSQQRGPSDLAIAFRHLLKPVIAQVHGHVHGAGLEMAMGCDIVIAAEGTGFASPFVKRAMGYGGNILPRYVGLRRATEMLFTGEPIDAETALAWGLINRVVPQEELEEEVGRWAERFSTSATVAMGLIKHNITRGWSLSVEEGYEVVNASQARSSRSEDAAEGPRAFREKRAPNFTGR
jgi:enoyl-CoA hydratase/carnithine racemase